MHATFADGHRASADILIGCDGIGSPTRTHVSMRTRRIPLQRFGGSRRLRSGRRAVADATQHFVFGRRSFFGYLVRADSTVYWFANITADEPSRGSLRDVSSAEWLDRLRDLPGRPISGAADHRRP